MKKTTLIIAVALMATLSSYAQGTIGVNNIVTGQVRAPVYGTEPGNPFLAKEGNTSAGTPAGTQTYGGALLAGAGFSVQLYGGTSSASEGSLTPSSIIFNFRSGSASGFLDNPNGLTGTIVGVPEGGIANIQLRAWDNQGGTITSWEAATTRGESPVFASQPLGGVLTTPPNLVGLQSFNLAQIPEPSTIALGLLGAGSLLFLRRKK